MEPQPHKPIDTAPSSAQPMVVQRFRDVTGWNIAGTYGCMLVMVMLGYSNALHRGLSTGKVYGTEGLDLVFKCLVFGSIACGLLGLTALLTRSRDTRWLFYAIVIVLSLLSFFIDEWKPLLQFRR